MNKIDYETYHFYNRGLTMTEKEILEEETSSYELAIAKLEATLKLEEIIKTKKNNLPTSLKFQF